MLDRLPGTLGISLPFFPFFLKAWPPVDERGVKPRGEPHYPALPPVELDFGDSSRRVVRASGCRRDPLDPGEGFELHLLFPELLHEPRTCVSRTCSLDEGVLRRLVVDVAHGESSLEFLSPHFSCRDAREDFRLANHLALSAILSEDFKELVCQVPPEGLEGAVRGIEQHGAVACGHTGGRLLVRFAGTVREQVYWSPVLPQRAPFSASSFSCGRPTT